MSAIGNVIANTDLVEMAMAYSRSYVLCAAARLEIADALGDSEHAVEDLAQSCHADTDSLYRLLRTLAALGITVELSPRCFALTTFGQPLRKDAPNSVWASVIFWSDLLADSWSHLTECIRSGDNAAEVMRRSGITSRWATAPDGSDIFRAVMGTAPAQDYLPIAKHWDFGSCHVVADLGGGGGSLLAAILSTWPHLEGILADRPESIAAAKPRFATDEFKDRCQLISVDMSVEVPTGADTYLLKHVLHGCKDVAAAQILFNCRNVMDADARLLIIEFVLPNVVSAPDPSLQLRLMSDLNMLAVTGGKERSESEWSMLLQSAGFDTVQFVPVPEMDVSIIEARPAS